jgi:hypothetical protein
VTRSNWPNHRADAIADERSRAKAGRNEALACQSLVRHNHGHTRYCKRPRERKQRWGRIVNVASTHGLVASTHKAAYVAAKHGLVRLTKVVGLETAGSGVTCNAVCPGWVRTPLVEKQISDIAAQRSISQKEAVKELLAEQQPSLDFVSPAQLGGTVAFLYSSAADQITGTAISERVSPDYPLYPSSVPCPLPRRTEQGHASIACLFVLPSPTTRRVGVRIGSFEDCSGFNRVTAGWIARPPISGLRHETPVQPVTRPNRSSATGPIDNYPDGIHLRW